MKPSDYSETTLETVQKVTTYVLREPVKEAVREALQEEAAAVKKTNESAAKEESVPALEAEPSDQDSSSSKLPLVAVLIGIGAVGYVIRRRRSSDDDSTQSGDTQTSHSTAREESQDAEKPEATESEDRDSSVTPVSDNS